MTGLARPSANARLKRMRNSAAAIVLGLLVAIASVVPASAGVEVYAAMGIDKNNVLSGTQLNAKVVPGEAKQVVCLVTYMTGKSQKDSAVNVRLTVFRRQGEGDGTLTKIFSNDYGATYGGLVGAGDLEVFDLDRDGINEIIVSFDSYVDPLIQQRLGEVILWDEQNFRVGWAGPLEYDATRAARSLPPERRDQYVREINLPRTMGTKGVTLFFDKHMIAVAGEKLAEPKIVQESFPLRRREGF